MPCRPGGDGGRHPPEHALGQGRRPRGRAAASWSTTTCAPPIPAIFAVGECVEHRGQCYGLVAPIWEMCRSAGRRADRDGTGGLRGLGHSRPAQGLRHRRVLGRRFLRRRRAARTSCCATPRAASTSASCCEDDQVVGAVLYGDTADGDWYFDLLSRARTSPTSATTLIFGQAFARRGCAADPSAGRCGDGRRRRDLRLQRRLQGQDRRGDPRPGPDHAGRGARAVPRHRASCGSCTGAGREAADADAWATSSRRARGQAVCKCTSFGHDEVRRLIVAQELKSIPAGDAGAALDHARRLRLLPPGAQLLSALRLARRIRRRPAEPLRQRADARQHPEGRHLFGRAAHVGRADQPARAARHRRRGREVRRRRRSRSPAASASTCSASRRRTCRPSGPTSTPPGMVSGHAYGKALRTVKTCVGTEWCRFGTQDSTGLGVKIEKMTWGSWTPHKVKIAVSGCPRNCAEATIKDFGVVCVDSGYEIHVGGNGGIHVRGTDLLCKVATEEEALEYLRRLHPALPRGGALPRAHRASGWSGSASTTSRRASSRTRTAAARSHDALPLFAALHAGRPLGRARRRRDAASSTRSPRPQCALALDALSMTRDWTRYRRGRPDIPRAARDACRRRRRARSRSSAPATARSSRWSTAARTRAGRCSQGIVHGHA